MSVESLDTATGTATAGTPVSAPTTATEGTAPAGTPSEAAGNASSTIDTSSQTTEAQSQSLVPQNGEATNPEGSEQPANPWESNDNVYKKRYNDALPHLQRTYQEKQLLEQRYKALEQEHQSMRQAEAERSKQLQLKDWHPRSPNYQQTKQVFDRVDNFIKAKSALPADMQTPEILRGMAEQFGVTADDAKVYQQVQNDRRQTQERLMSDPESFLDEFIAPRIQQELQRFEAFNAARGSAEKFLTDPKVQPLIEKYAVDMDRMMDPQVPGRDKALLVAQLMAENEAMKAKLGESAIESAQAEAKQSLLQGNGRGDKQRVRVGQDSEIANPLEHFRSKGLKGVELATAIARYNQSKRR